MSKLALFVKTRVQPGKREEVRQLWEKHLKAQAEKNAAQEIYLYCYDDNDPDTLFIFELYHDSQAFHQAGPKPWFADYMKEAAPLLQGRSEVSVATPVWAKGVTL
jgi:quinol monooxygenase YgiN